MSFVALTCPECGYLKTYNGRGKCRCGVYLIHHATGSVLLTGKGRVWVMNEARPRLLHDDSKRPEIP